MTWKVCSSLCSSGCLEIRQCTLLLRASRPELENGAWSVLSCTAGDAWLSSAWFPSCASESGLCSFGSETRRLVDKSFIGAFIRMYQKILTSSVICRRSSSSDIGSSSQPSTKLAPFFCFFSCGAARFSKSKLTLFRFFAAWSLLRVWASGSFATELFFPVKVMRLSVLDGPNWSLLFEVEEL